MSIWTMVVGAVWLISLAIVISSIVETHQDLDFYENSGEEMFIEDYMKKRKELRKWEIVLIGHMVIFFM